MTAWQEIKNSKKKGLAKLSAQFLNTCEYIMLSGPGALLGLMMTTLVLQRFQLPYICYSIDQQQTGGY